MAKLTSVHSPRELISFIQVAFPALSNDYLRLGDALLEDISEKSDAFTEEVFLLHFDVPEIFKQVALLHRDTVLQLQIAKHKFQEHFIPEEQVSAHFEASKVMLQQALASLQQRIESPGKGKYNRAYDTNGLGKRIKHQKNPWSVYKEQFQAVRQQCKDIDRADSQISKAIGCFSGISEYHQHLLKELLAFNEDLKNKASELIRLLKNATTLDDIQTILDEVDATIPAIERPSQNQERYTKVINDKIKVLRVVNIPVGTHGGLMLIKKTDFGKSVKKWLDYEVLPSFIDVWDHVSNMESYFKLALLNLKNSLTLIKNDEDLPIVESQLQTLKGVHRTLMTNVETHQITTTNILKKFEHVFKVCTIYVTDGFLEVSLQSSLTQFTSGQKSLFAGFTAWVKNIYALISSKYDQAKTVDASMALERSTLCIRHRMFKEENAQYDMLFLNKSFTGDLFIASRNEQEARVQSIVSQWREGFNKSVLVTGNRLSGRTTFLEQMAKSHFDRDTIHLKVEGDVTIEGRKFTTSRDLGHALSEVNKAVYNSRPLLLIDDLEVWQSDAISLLENVRNLMHFVESESDTVLVMVSTNRALQNHLDLRLPFSQVFSNVIDLSRAKIEEIFQALIVRHGASHKTLVDVNKEPYSPKQIEDKVKDLAKKYNQNMGEVLQAWTYGATLMDLESVWYKEDDVPFIDFLTDAETIVLKQLVLSKYTNEMILKRFLGKRFNGVFRSALRRLIQAKVLLRNDQGWLHINPVVLTDVDKILKYRGTIN